MKIYASPAHPFFTTRLLWQCLSAPSKGEAVSRQGAGAAWFTTASASSGRQSEFRHGSSLLFHQLNAQCSAGVSEVGHHRCTQIQVKEGLCSSTQPYNAETHCGMWCFRQKWTRNMEGGYKELEVKEETWEWGGNPTTASAIGGPQFYSEESELLSTFSAWRINIILRIQQPILSFWSPKTSPFVKGTKRRINMGWAGMSDNSGFYLCPAADLPFSTVLSLAVSEACLWDVLTADGSVHDWLFFL